MYAEDFAETCACSRYACSTGGSESCGPLTPRPVRTHI